METRRQIVALAALLLLTAAVYVPGLRGEFQFDDLHTVELNQDIRRLDSFARAPSVSDMLLGKRVLTDLTFALNYRLAGNDPLPFHVTNLAIHLGAVLLMFFFTRRMLVLGGAKQEDLLALTVTALFALHPLQTQAVEYVSQRAESLASALYIASLLLLLGAERRGRSTSGVASYAGSFVLFALGLGAKIIVVTLPLAYLLVGMLPEAQARDRLAKPRYRAALIAPFFLYGGLVGSLMVAGLSGEDAGFRVPSLPPGRYFLTQCHVIVVYLRLLVWPAGQNVDWDLPLANEVGDPVVLVCGIFLLSLLAGAVFCLLRARGRDGRSAATVRTATFGIFWFFLLLAPTSSFIPLADVLMEHRLYLASWGIFLAIVVSAAAAFERLSTRVRSGLALVSVLAICSVLAMASYARVGLWRTKRSLWSDAVAKSPGKSRVHLGLGNAYRREGEPERALQEYRLALSLAGSDPRWQRSEIRGKLASVLLAQSRASDAIAEVEAGLGEDPDDSVLLGVLAMAHLQRHEPAQAEDAAERSVRSAKRPGASLRILGLAHEAAGHLEAATSAFKRAVALEPDEAQGGLLLARSYRALGRPRDACAVLGAIRQPGSELRAPLADALAPCPPP